MKYNILFKEENEAIKERYDLAMERILLIQQEETVAKPYDDYFKRTATFISSINDIVTLVQEDRLSQLSRNELEVLNTTLYDDIIGEHYSASYANPAYAAQCLGEKYGILLSFLQTELRGLIIYAYESRLYALTIYLELFIEIYNYFEEIDEYTYKDVKRAIYDFMSDYCDQLIEDRIRELLDNDLTFARDIIMSSDLTDISYLYHFGDYISDNEIWTAKFLNSMPEEQVKAMADTFTEGYRLGFVANRLDLSKKKNVNIRYPLGFERMVRYAILNFEKMGLEAHIFRAQYNAVNKLQHLKVGFHATSPNRQYDYDHRFDIGLFLDKEFKEKKLECYKNSLEKYKELGAVYAGPAVIEVFGEKLFAPEDKKEVVKLDKRQQKIYVDYYQEEDFLKQEYLKIEETSFTIISYPISEIGPKYKEIFAETVKVNTLDNDKYRGIQQYIIDALDQGEYVKILGAGNNHTDMVVQLYPMKDPSKETVFENCIADVNIPVGEVFTSPKLTGTKGVLHVPQIYLHDLEYKDLKLIFEDGKINDYYCANFTEEKKNKDFIKENLMYNHDYLPIGEFAIGTNTTAYMMGRKYDIAAQLPILIAEKTGPHFAVGDTCFKMAEDIKTYNPDGKQMIAKDNEVSLLRKTEPAKAYFNCHTDITLPYDELKEITVYRHDGTTIPILKDARFVLKGTEELNEAFDH